MHQVNPNKASKENTTILCFYMIKTTHDSFNVLVFWIPWYPGPPAPRPLQRTSSGPGVERQPKPAEKTLMRRRLMRRTTTKTAKDQKTSSRASAGEGRDHVHVSSARLHAEQEDKGGRPRTAHATLDREETNFCHACIKRQSGCWPPP
jgi:hypothetical protein